MNTPGQFVATPPGQPDRIVIAGRSYGLDRLPDSPLMKATLPEFREAYPEVPEAKWGESDQFETFDPPTLMQVQNGCTGHALCTAFWLAWVAAGHDPLDFSPTWGYAMANGGIDQGAPIGAMLAVAQRYGLCLASTFPEDHWSPAQATPAAYAEAAKYKVVKGYQADTWGQVGTALHKGFPVELSVQVGPRFLHADADNFVPVEPGPGNHAVVSAGIRRFQGKVGLKTKTSWGPDAFDNGCFFIAKAHTLTQAYFSAVVIETVESADDAPIAGPIA